VSTRRTVLAWGAVATGAAAASAAIPAAQAAPDPVAEAMGESSSARVVAAAGGMVTAAVRARMKPRDTPPVDQHTAVTGLTLRIPLVGFPDGFSLRPGDLVTVVELDRGAGPVAVPVCRWVTGIPREAPGGYSIAGQLAVADPRFAAAAGEGRSVTASLLDSELPAAQVLSVR
jgi:hypothetical protein